MDITHYGHACLLVEAAGARVLVDPGAFSPGWEDLDGLDAVVVTHEHFDHMDTDRLPTLLEGNPGARLIAEPGVAAQLKGTAARDAEALAVGDTTSVNGLSLGAVGGRHAVIHRAFPELGNVGILMSADGEPTLFHPGDELDATPEGVDVLALPVSAPWCALQDTIDFLQAVHPRVALPVHDAILSPGGRGFFLQVIGNLLPDGTELRDVTPGQRTSLT